MSDELDYDAPNGWHHETITVNEGFRFVGFGPDTESPTLTPGIINRIKRAIRILWFGE